MEERTRELESVRLSVLEAERKVEAADAERARHEAEANAARAKQEAATRSLARQQFLASYVYLPIGIGLALGFAAHPYVTPYFAEAERVWAARVSATTLGLLPIAFSAALSTLRVPRNSALVDWLPAKLLAQIGGKAVIAPLVMAASAVYQGGVWDSVKAALGWQ